MASVQRGWTCLRCSQTQSRHSVASASQSRAFSRTARRLDEAEAVQETVAPPRAKKTLLPDRVQTPRLERRLIKDFKLQPIGSRRRRAALRNARQIPFEQMPYQCFQEARKILVADRAEKLKQIETQRARMTRVREQQVEPQQEAFKERRIISMEQHLQELKIFADINDPTVKRKFEDGDGDMDKPIYRYLAQKKWESYDKKINVQRIEQYHLVPDILQSLEPKVEVDLSFGRRKVESGAYIESETSERAPKMRIQPFEKGERLVTIACINPDVPSVAKDGFDSRCHYLACNVKISPKDTSVLLGQLSATEQVVLPWLPAYTQKGAPYQRMAFFVLEQKDRTPIDVQTIQQKVQRDGFFLRSFVDRHLLYPIGAELFKSQWDEGTAGVMQRLGVPGHDVEFKRMKVEPLPYKRLSGARYR